MYSPVKDGINKAANSVHYIEAKPPTDLAGLVDCFWELKTDEKLPDDFCLHALPDACTNILFNLVDTNIAAITALQTTHQVLNLGTSFHYAGIQLLPGVWQGDRSEIKDSLVDMPYVGALPLSETANKLATLNFVAMQSAMAGLVYELKDAGVIAVNPVMTRILSHLELIHTVADMAQTVDMSPRQLQRVLKQTTGFSPHDLLKVLRLQRSFKGQYLGSYADQSHYIHSFRKITGYTPASYDKKFDV